MGRVIVGGVLLLAGALLFLQALRAGFAGPAAAPVIVTGLWVAVAATYLTGQLVTKRLRDAERPRWRMSFLLLGMLVTYASVLKYTVAGYVLATTAFFLVSARLLSSRPVREVILRDASVAIGLSLAIYLVFTRLLGIVLPAGVLSL